MNGPQHFAEAERLTDLVAGMSGKPMDLMVAIAQVHATLALAAAFATVLDSYRSETDSRAWWSTLNLGPGAS